MLSEVLKGREIQRNLNKEKKEELKKKTEIQNRMHMEQAGRWIDDYNQKQLDGRKRFDQYKKDLHDLCEERAKNRNDKKKARISMERNHNEQHRRTYLQENAQVKENAEKKREALRKNAIEAMLMAEQRRARLKQADEIQVVVANIHKEGKDDIKQLITQQEKNMKIENLQSKAVLLDEAQKLVLEEKEKLKIEQENIERVSQEKLLILDEKEKQKIEQLRKMKEQRILEHLADQERRKKESDEKKEDDKYYFKQRIRNDKISKEYTKIKYVKKAEKVKENRKFLVDQIKEKQQQEAQAKIEKRKFDKSKLEAQDKKFYNYAEELCQDAMAKERPTFPLIKSVQQYKRHNHLDVKYRELPHVISNVPIGRAYQIEETPNAKKSKTRIRYELDQMKMMNPYRSMNFMKNLNH